MIKWVRDIPEKKRTLSGVAEDLFTGWPITFGYCSSRKSKTFQSLLELFKDMV